MLDYGSTAIAVACFQVDPSLIFTHLRRPQECKGEEICFGFMFDV